MFFSEIKPFVRYIHYLSLNPSAAYNCKIPCDARLFYLCEGTGEISVGSQCFTLKKGDILLLNSGIAYQIHAPKTSAVYLAVNFDYTFSHTSLNTPIPPVSPEAFQDSCLIERVTFDDLPLFNEYCVIRDLHKVHTLLHKIREEYQQKLLYHEMNESQLFTQVLLEAARALKSPALQSKKDIAPRILDYIHEQYPDSLTNQKIAEAFGFHPNYVNALIKTCTGMSLHAYLLQVRLDHSADLLENSTLSIGEIAETCGFYDIFHFSRCFKQKMGISPSQYRHMQW